MEVGFLNQVIDADMIQHHSLAIAGVLAQLPGENYAANKLAIRRPYIERIRASTAERITRATEAVSAMIEERGCTPRQAAYLIAVGRQRDAVFAAGP